MGRENRAKYFLAYSISQIIFMMQYVHVTYGCSPMYFKVLFTLKCLRGKIKEKLKKHSHLMVHSPNVLKGQGWMGSKPGTGNSFQASQQLARIPSLTRLPLTLGSAFTRNELEARARARDRTQGFRCLS